MTPITSAVPRLMPEDGTLGAPAPLPPLIPLTCPLPNQAMTPLLPHPADRTAMMAALTDATPSAPPPTTPLKPVSSRSSTELTAHERCGACWAKRAHTVLFPPPLSATTSSPKPSPRPSSGMSDRLSWSLPLRLARA